MRVGARGAAAQPRAADGSMQPQAVDLMHDPDEDLDAQDASALGDGGDVGKSCDFVMAPAHRCVTCSITELDVRASCKAAGHPTARATVQLRFYSCGKCGNLTHRVNTGPLRFAKSCCKEHSMPLPLPHHLPLPALKGACVSDEIGAMALVSLSGMLNDEIIGSSLDHTHARFPQLHDKVLFINPFLFQKLREPDDAAKAAASARYGGQRVPVPMTLLAGALGVQRWTRRLGGAATVLNAQWLVVPMCAKAHWTLGLIARPGRPGSFMIHLDSYMGLHTEAVVAAPLRAWLTCMIVERDGCSLDTAWQSLDMSYEVCAVQQQPNGSVDCGLFLCEFASRFCDMVDLNEPFTAGAFKAQFAQLPTLSPHDVGAPARTAMYKAILSAHAEAA